MKKLTEYIKENVINTAEFGKNNFGVSGQAVYDKIINRIRLTRDDKDFIENSESVFIVNEKQLRQLIKQLKGKNISLNWLDVSGIADMGNLFRKDRNSR